MFSLWGKALAVVASHIFDRYIYIGFYISLYTYRLYKIDFITKVFYFSIKQLIVIFFQDAHSFTSPSKVIKGLLPNLKLVATGPPSPVFENRCAMV